MIDTVGNNWQNALLQALDTDGGVTTWARADSRPQRKTMIDAEGRCPSRANVSCWTCRGRAIITCHSLPFSDQEPMLMELIARCYLEHPYYGARRVKDWLFDVHGLNVRDEQHSGVYRPVPCRHDTSVGSCVS